MADLGVTNVSLLGNVKQTVPAGEAQKQERLYGKPSFTGEDQFVTSQTKKKDLKKDIAKSVAILLGTILGYNLIRRKVDIAGLFKKVKASGLGNLVKEFGAKAEAVAKRMLHKGRLLVKKSVGKAKVRAEKLDPEKFKKLDESFKNALKNIKNNRAERIVQRSTIKAKMGVQKFIDKYLRIGHRPKSAQASAKIFEKVTN